METILEDWLISIPSYCAHLIVFNDSLRAELQTNRCLVTRCVCETQMPPSATKQKGRDLTQSYDKRPYTHKKSRTHSDIIKNATKNFDYTTIVDRLRTVSRGNSSHPTGVVKRVLWAPTYPLTATAV